jgi:hypothetical protein
MALHWSQLPRVGCYPRTGVGCRQHAGLADDDFARADLARWPH